MPPPNTQQQGPSLGSLYSELNRLIIMGDYEKTLKTCNRILHIAPDEVKALQCKIVSFIHMSKFSEALNAINHAHQSDNFLFEQAYCYYRLNKPDDAIKILEHPNAEHDNRLPELKAQVLYRLERYDECKQLYQDVIKNSHDDYQDERETNLGAVIAGLVATSESKNANVPELRDETYELCYNKACRMVAEENFIEAEKMLRKCEKLCMEQLLDDEETEEEIEDELAIIRVQLGYCIQMQGRENEAHTLYQRVLKHKPDDITLLAVAANNCVVINSTHNVFDSKKKLKIATSEAAELKLTKAQRKTIAANNCLFNVINAIGNYKTQCDALLKKYPDMEFIATVGIALGKLREGDDQNAIEYLLKNVEKPNQKNYLQMYLFAAHIALMKENREKAIEILLKLGDDKYLPGVVSTIVTLYVGQEEPEKASKLLDETVDWYRKNRSGKPGLEKMYREAANFHMRNEEPEAAAKCLEEILMLHPDSRQIIAQLVMAYAQIKSPKAKDLSDRLPPINTKGLDVDDLESANWMMGLKSNRSTRPQATVDSPPTTPRDPYAKKHKKKRRGKLPKDYIEGETPDPERWLPKYERTGFRKKRDRRAKDIIKGSQGSSTTNASDAYDFSSYSGGGGESAKTETTPQQHSSHQKSSGNFKKKKGRR